MTFKKENHPRCWFPGYNYFLIPLFIPVTWLAPAPLIFGTLFPKMVISHWFRYHLFSKDSDTWTRTGLHQASLVAQMVKNLFATRETRVRSMEDSMASHFSILAWRTPMDKGAWKAAVHGVAKSPFIVAVSSRWNLYPWTSHVHAHSNTLCSEEADTFA